MVQGQASGGARRRGPTNRHHVSQEDVWRGLGLPSGKRHQIRVKRPFVKLTWSKNEALFGEPVDLVVELPPGAAAGRGPIRLTIFEHDADGSRERVGELVAHREGAIAVAPWNVVYRDDSGDAGYDGLPEFFFEARDGAEKGSSGTGEGELLHAVHAVSVRLLDHEWKPIGKARAVVTLADDTRVTKDVGEDGVLFHRPAPPGLCRIEMEGEGFAEVTVPTVDSYGAVIDVRVPVLRDAPGDPPDELFDLTLGEMLSDALGV